MTDPNAPPTRNVQAAHFEAILKTARDAVVSINRSGEIVLFNPAAEEIFGYKAEEVLGAEVQILMPAPYREEHNDYVRRYEETGEPRAIGKIREVHGLRKNGEVFPMELAVSEVGVESGVFYTAVIRDVTARHRTQIELERMRRVSHQSQRLADIGAVTAKVVHDLANPIAALSMVSQGILMRIENTPDTTLGGVKSQAERLVATTERLNSLLGEFKDFARGQRLELCDLDLNALFEAVRTFWLPEAVAAQIDLHVHTPTDRVEVRGDREKLNRVFDNLVRNALDAIGERPGRIDVELDPPQGDRVRIRVRDTGPGVPDGADIFALFETTKAGGTGFGLPICRQIMEAHGGSIVAEPNPAGGAVFVVEMPVDGDRAHPDPD